MTFAVHRSLGSATDFHARPVPDPAGRAVHVLTVDRPALVLGSAQRGSVADAEACAAAGVEVVRRQSGGGAVLLDPGDATWIDVELPRGDPLWHDDVGRAAWWLGDVLAAALDHLGVPGLAVHRGGLDRAHWGDLVCFAGIGPGEVTAGGRKVVGLSQRRTRSGARFQVAIHRRWEPARLAGLLALPDDRRSALAAELADAVATVEAVPDAVVDAVLRQLPA